MYKIYSDEHILYDELGEDSTITNSRLSQESNKTSIFSFEIYPQHIHYDRLNRLKSIIRIEKEGTTIFQGRFIDDVKGFYNQRHVTCEGSLSFLVDSVIRPYTYPKSPDSVATVAGLFEKLIDEHNDQVEEDKKLMVGNVTVTDPNGYIHRSNSEYQTTLENIKTRLLEPLGGYLVLRYEYNAVTGKIETYIDYIAEIEEELDQEIEFAVNLLDYKLERKGADIFTAIIPLGATLEPEEGEAVDPDAPKKRLTIESVNGGVDYLVNDEGVEKYGYIAKTVIWDDVTEPARLKNKALQELENGYLLPNTIELSAVDLSYTGIEIDSFAVGKKVKIKSEPHGLEDYYVISKLDRDILNPSNDRLTLGKTFASLTEQNRSESEKIKKQVNDDIIFANKVTTKAIEVADSRIDSVNDDLGRLGETVTNLETETDKAQTDTENKLKTLTQYVETKTDSESVQIQISEALSDGVNKIETSTGFRFDEKGLNVSKSGADTSTTITEDGMTVSKTDEVMLTANSAGVEARNLHATTYLIVGGRSRFENYEEDRTGCFWIGG